LYESGRDSITLSIPEVTPASAGALIALYERAVGFYASLVNINAYHQPGVEAGKKAATVVLKTIGRVRGVLSATPQTAGQIATALGEDPEAVYHALNHLAANTAGVQATRGATAGADAFFLP
jgi:glucose-6-phosphate isomerase